MLLILEQIWKMLLCDLGINDYFVIHTFNDKGRFLEFTVISLLALKVSSAKFLNFNNSLSTSATWKIQEILIK
jgi:hypothetical protein